MDGGKVVLFGGAAAALAWWQGWLAPLGFPGPSTGSPSTTTTPPTATNTPPMTTTPPSTTVPPPASTSALPSLDSVYLKFAANTEAAQQAQLQAGGNRFGPDDYDAILVQTLASMGVPDPGLPDPNQLFGPSGWSRPNAMPIAAYWSGISGWLTSNKGFSGLYGLGAFGCAFREMGFGGRW